MHPIEHLRYVARSRGFDASEIVRESAVALASLRADGPNLVIACRRIVERHPEIGPLWWLCARLLTTDDPCRLAWDLAGAVDGDPAPRAIAAAVPADATVVTIGWPEVGGAALERRGDVRVLCTDSRHSASGFLRLLERASVECEPVASESLARAVAVADLVMVEGLAAAPQRVLAPIGSHVLAAVASQIGVPVWCTVGIGRRLPIEYVDAIAERIVADRAPYDLDVDDLPVQLVSHVASADGVSTDVAAALRAECGFAPELLRASPI